MFSQLGALWRQLGALWRRWVVRISFAQVLSAAALGLAADQIFLRVVNGASSWPVIFDWTAHLATSLLILNLLPLGWRRAILVPALIFSVVIDADHVPEYYFHTRVLTEGTQRPYTHSLTTVAVLLILALLWPRGRLFLAGAAIGLCLHFFRDLAEVPGAGVSLLWPLTKHSYGYSHSVYLAIMAAVLLANLIRLALERRAGCGPGPGTGE